MNEDKVEMDNLIDGSSDKIPVDSGGDVGIGTAAPTFFSKVDSLEYLASQQRLLSEKEVLGLTSQMKSSFLNGSKSRRDKHTCAVSLLPLIKKRS